MLFFLLLVRKERRLLEIRSCRGLRNDSEMTLEDEKADGVELR